MPSPKPASPISWDEPGEPYPEPRAALREEAPAADDVRLVARLVVDLVPRGGRGPARGVGPPVASREAADVEGLGGAGRELRRDLVLLGGDGVDHLEPGWPGQGPPQDVRPLAQNIALNRRALLNLVHGKGQKISISTPGWPAR